MSRRLIDHDPETGIKTYHHYDDATDKAAIETVQDVTPIIEINKAQQKEGFEKRSELWHAATIPAVVQLEWMTKYGVDLYNKDHFPAVKRLLNSSEYSHLRRNEFKI